MKIAVTGAKGRLGSELVPYLLDQGQEVVVLDYAPQALEWSGARHVAIDVRHYEKVVDVLSGCDALVHLATNHSRNVAGFSDNAIGGYNVLTAAVSLGIERICLASSVNAIGGLYSNAPRYDYFPVDERHPCYAEDGYSLSKWAMEKTADAIVRRSPASQIASLRFHWLLPSRKEAIDRTRQSPRAAKHLWSYTLLREACRACLLALTADFVGHEVFLS